MNILLCDDDPLALKALGELVTAFFEENKIPVVYGTYNDGESAVADNALLYDLAFIDVEMPGINGLAVAKHLQERNSNVIIFMVTAFPGYLDDAMGLKVFRYLTKPVEQNRLHKNLRFALQQYNQQNQTILLDGTDGSHLIFTQEILFVGIHGRGSLIQTKSRQYHSYRSLKHWTDRLNPDLFSRPHHSYLVNLQNVRSLNKKEVMLTNEAGEPVFVPVAQRKYYDFSEVFFRYVGGAK